VYAWRYTVGDIPPRAQKAHDELAALPELKTRHIDMRNLDSEVRMVMTLDPMHSDEWTQRATMGMESQLGKLARVIAARSSK